MKQVEKSVRLVSVESEGPNYRKDNGLLCVVRVLVEAERPKDFDKLPLRLRARYAHAKGQNVAKYFFVSEFIDELKFLHENDTDNEFTDAQHETLAKHIANLTKINESEDGKDDAMAGKIIEKSLREFSCNTNGLLSIILTTASVKEILAGTQYDGVTAITVDSNGNEVTLNEYTDFNFIEKDTDAELSYLRNSLLQQIINSDAIPVEKSNVDDESKQNVNEKSIEKETDLIIIGAGPGGCKAAEYAAKQGLKVIIFEDGNVGGTCLNVGCIPTKTYVHSATFEEAREHMATVVPQLRAGVESILSHPNITLVRGKASFVDARSVCCATSATIETYTSPNIIIATGSQTKWLPIEGVGTDPRVVDSSGLLQLDTLPKKLCIIGAGVIGMEFASVFNRFGSEVTVIEYLKECLPALDSDIAKRLRKYMEKQGITFKMKTAVENVADLDADIILMATGRKPCTEGLNLEAVGITLTPQGAIPVDDNYQLSSPATLLPSDGRIINSQLTGIYAIGDVNGKQMLAHAAEMQAIHAVNHILGRQDNIRFDIMPAAIFTAPEAACVGPTEDQLKEDGIAYECRKSFWRANGKAQAMGQTEGMLKLFAASDDGLILGCHAYGAHAADMVQEVSALMCRDTTIAQLRDMVHIHPTLNEIVRAATES